MNKLTIPAILVATVMVAGIFAFMPVQQASTVHTSNTITLAADSISATEIANNAIGATEIATGAIDADALATDAVTEIGTLDRAFTWDLESVLAAPNIILIPATPGKDIAGRVVISQDAVVGQLCLVQSTDGATTIVTGTANTGEIVQAAFDTAANTPAGFATGEGIQIDAGAAILCTVTIFLESGSP